MTAMRLPNLDDYDNDTDMSRLIRDLKATEDAIEKRELRKQRCKYTDAEVAESLRVETRCPPHREHLIYPSPSSLGSPMPNNSTPPTDEGMRQAIVHFLDENGSARSFTIANALYTPASRVWQWLASHPDVVELVNGTWRLRKVDEVAK